MVLIRLMVFPEAKCAGIRQSAERGRGFRGIFKKRLVRESLRKFSVVNRSESVLYKAKSNLNLFRKCLRSNSPKDFNAAIFS